jgi:hypothetical protein
MEGVHPPGKLYEYKNRGLAAKGSCKNIRTKGVQFALLGRAACRGKFGRCGEREGGDGDGAGGDRYGVRLTIFGCEHELL